MQMYFETITIFCLLFFVFSYVGYRVGYSLDKHDISPLVVENDKRNILIYMIFILIVLDLFWGIFFITSDLFINSLLIRHIYIATQIGILILLQLIKVKTYE